MYMATKKQKIRKRKTFRGGANTWSNTGRNTELNKMSNRWSNPGANTWSNTGPPGNFLSGQGWHNPKNMEDFFGRVDKENAASSIPSIRPNAKNGSLKDWNSENAQKERAKRVQNALENARERQKRKRSLTVEEQDKRQAAEDRAKAGRKRKEEKANIGPVNSNVAELRYQDNPEEYRKKEYTKFIKEINEDIRRTQGTIMELNKQLTEQQNSLMSIQSQSFPFMRSHLSRFTGAPTSESIKLSINTISEQITKQSTILRELNEKLAGFENYLAKARSKQKSKPMTN